MKKIISILTILITAVIFKTNGQANFQWAKSIGGGLGNDRGHSIKVDASGNVYCTGYFTGTVDFDPGSGVFNLISAGSIDVFISKLDAAGGFVWAKQIGGFGAVSKGNSIAIDAANNIYITGTYNGTVDFDPGVGIYNLTPVSSADIFVSKLDASGAFLWAKSMGEAIGYSIAVDGTGNVYTTGEFSNTADFDPGPGIYNITSLGQEDIFISKLDALGNFVWVKNIGEPGYDKGFCIAVDAVGNVYTTGAFSNTADFDPGSGVYTLTASVGKQDLFISKLDASGNFVLAKNIGGTSDVVGYSLAVDGAGYIYSTGYFFGTGDFDPDVGVYNLTSVVSSNVFVSKLDALGAFVWAKNIGGTGSSIGNSISIDASSNIYITGQFGGTPDFDPGASVYSLTSAGQFDVFISKLDASGNFIWVKQMGGTSNDYGTSITLDVAGNVYATGYYSGTGDFDPGTGVYNLTSAGAFDVFVVKLDNAVGVEEIVGTNDFTINVFPNPGIGKINISTLYIYDGEFLVSVKDVTGKNIYTNNIQILTGKGCFNLDVINGVYFVEITNAKTGERAIKKLIIAK